jgi:hypothetical protein
VAFDQLLYHLEEKHSSEETSREASKDQNLNETL